MALIYLIGASLTALMFVIASYSEEWRRMMSHRDRTAHVFGVIVLVIVWPITLLIGLWMAATGRLQ